MNAHQPGDQFDQVDLADLWSCCTVPGLPIGARVRVSCRAPDE